MNRPPNNDELERAIDELTLKCEQARVGLNTVYAVYPSQLERVLSAAKRCQQVEKERDELRVGRLNAGQSIAALRSALASIKSKVEELEKERDELNGVGKLLHELMVSGENRGAAKGEQERTLLQHQLSQYKAALEDLEKTSLPVGFFLRDYLRTTTHPGVSRLLHDLNEALSLVKQVLKEAK